MTIYVGNLSYQVTEDDLTKVFAEYASVKRVQLPVDRETARVRGFSFVDTETEAEEIAAIESLNGGEWRERSLKVNKARPRTERNSSDRSWGDKRNSSRRY